MKTSQTLEFLEQLNKLTQKSLEHTYAASTDP